MLMVSASSAFVHPAIRTGAAAGTTTSRQMFNFFGTAKTGEYPIMAEESVMSQKKHGTSDAPVQKNLRWNCDFQTADRSE